VVHPSAPVADRTTDTVAVHRRADKARRFSVGMGMGALGSRTFDGARFANYGLDAQFRYRIADPLGVELAVGYFDDLRRDEKRLDVPVQFSAMLHTPGYWPVGAFVLAGFTVAYRDYDLRCIGGDHLRGTVGGPHVGGGLNVNLGPSATLEWDVRFTGYMGRTGFDGRGTDRGNVTTSLSVNIFF
jgi:hypothetical protein